MSGQERLRLRLPNVESTLALGRRFGVAARTGDVIGLTGPLGAGKTTFVLGLAAGLGITGPVPSPTFVLIREYRGRLPLAHVDAYRLDGAEDALAMGLDEYLPGEGVTVVEWSDRIAELLPPEAVEVALALDGDGRSAAIRGPELSRWLAEERVPPS